MAMVWFMSVLMENLFSRLTETERKEWYGISDNTYMDWRNLGGRLMASSIIMAISTEEIWSTRRFCRNLTDLASSTSFKSILHKHFCNIFKPELWFSKAKVHRVPVQSPAPGGSFWQSIGPLLNQAWSMPHSYCIWNSSHIIALHICILYVSSDRNSKMSQSQCSKIKVC